MSKYTYKTSGVCSQFLTFDLEDGKLHDISFYGGCDGNLKAIGKLAEGMEAQKVADLLRGNTCGYKETSCGDQLAKAITAALEAESGARA